MQTDMNEQFVEEAMAKLEPFIQQSNIEGFKSEVKRLTTGGKNINEVATAASRLSITYPDLFEQIRDSLQGSDRYELNAYIFEILIDILTRSGLRIEEHFRTIGEFVFLTRAAIQAMQEAGFNSPELKSWGVDNINDYGFKRMGGFVHPFSVTKRLEDEGRFVTGVNLWTAVSGVISIAQGWFTSSEAGQAECLTKLKRWVVIASPQIDFDILLHRSRYDDAALDALCRLAHRGLALTLIKNDQE